MRLGRKAGAKFRFGPAAWIFILAVQGAMGRFSTGESGPSGYCGQERPKGTSVGRETR